jgi:hypothetical protein
MANIEECINSKNVHVFTWFATSSISPYQGREQGQPLGMDWIRLQLLAMGSNQKDVT